MSETGGTQWIKASVGVSVLAILYGGFAMFMVEPGLWPFFIVDLVVLVGLTWGFSRQNRACAVLLPLWFFIEMVLNLLLEEISLVGLPVVAVFLLVYLMGTWTIFTQHAWRRQVFSRQLTPPLWPRVLLMLGLLVAIAGGAGGVFAVYLAPPALLVESEISAEQRALLQEVNVLREGDPVVLFVPEPLFGLADSFTLITEERVVLSCEWCEPAMQEMALHDIVALSLERGRTNLDPSVIVVEQGEDKTTIVISPVAHADERLFQVLDEQWQQASDRWLAKKKVEMAPAVEKDQLIPISPEDRERVLKQYGLSGNKPLEAGRYQRTSE